jgi:hypothetical protein
VHWTPWSDARWQTRPPRCCCRPAPNSSTVASQACHESLSEAVEALDKANLPLGFLATTFDSSYTEASLKRGAGFIDAHAAEGEAHGRASVAAALNKAIVIDLTAAHILALLDPQLRSQLISGFAQVRATDEAYRDAVRGQESLGLRSTMSTGWDPDTERPTVTEIEQSVADRLAEQSSVVYSILHQANRRPSPRLTIFPDVDQKFRGRS